MRETVWRVRRFFCVLPLVFAIGRSEAIAQIECVKCHDGNGASEGWKESPDLTVCGLQCQNIKDKACQMDCVNADTVPAGPGFDSALNPGLLIEQRGGKLLVLSVIPESPAAQAGIRSGDEITSVNGTLPGRSCTLTTWRSRDSAAVSVITLRREGVARKVELALLPMRQFEARLWTGAQPRDAVADQFSVGLTWEADANAIRVTGLLLGGAAARAGVALGDRIVSIDSRGAADESALADLQPRDRRYAVKLGVIRKGRVNEISVESTSLIEALSAVSSSETRASAGLSVVAQTGSLE